VIRRPIINYTAIGIRRASITVASLSVNDSAIMKIKGVKRVIRLPYGVAIIGDTVEATKKGREALEVKC
jgi:hypothetical protein